MTEIFNLPLFKGVNPEVLANLFRKQDIIRRTYHKGVTVHEQGTACTGLDVLAKGNLIAYTLSPNGSETVAFNFKPHDIIGANLIFADNNKYPMNIYTTCPCTIFHLGKDIIVELLKDHSFVLAFIRSLSLNSQGLNQRFTMHTQKTLRENILDYLLALSQSQGSNPVLLPISKKQLADFLGVQRPSLFRELKRLQDEGLLEIANRKISLNL